MFICRSKLFSKVKTAAVIVRPNLDGRDEPRRGGLWRRLRRGPLGRPAFVVLAGDGAVPLRHAPELQEEVAAGTLRVVADLALWQRTVLEHEFAPEGEVWLLGMNLAPG
jgi:hypothetical protein